MLVTNSSANQLNLQAVGTEATASTDEVSGANPVYAMSPQGVLAYCEDQMQSINAQFNEQVEGIQKSNNSSTLIGNLKSELASYEAGGINWDPTAANNAGAPKDTGMTDTYTKIDNDINTAIGEAQASGDTGLVASLQSIKATFENGGDSSVSPQEITSMCDGLDSAASTVTSNQQVSMITVGQIANTLNSVMTQMSQIIQGMDQTSLKIAGNT